MPALSSAAYFRKLVRGLEPSAPGGPSLLRCDNKAARDLAYNPEHHDRTKHIARRHFFIRELVEDGSLTVPAALRPYMGGKETILPDK